MLWTLVITVFLMVLALIQVKLLTSLHFEAWRVHPELRPSQTFGRVARTLVLFLPTPLSLMYGVIGLHVGPEVLGGRRRTFLVTLGVLAALVLAVLVTAFLGQDGSASAVDDFSVVSVLLVVLTLAAPIGLLVGRLKAARNAMSRANHSSIGYSCGE